MAPFERSPQMENTERKSLTYVMGRDIVAETKSGCSGVNRGSFRASFLKWHAYETEDPKFHNDAFYYFRFWRGTYHLVP